MFQFQLIKLFVTIYLHLLLNFSFSHHSNQMTEDMQVFPNITHNQGK
jgi:hypothetical protein